MYYETDHLWRYFKCSWSVSSIFEILNEFFYIKMIVQIFSKDFYLLYPQLCQQFF